MKTEKTKQCLNLHGQIAIREARLERTRKELDHAMTELSKAELADVLLGMDRLDKRKEKNYG